MKITPYHHIAVFERATVVLNAQAGEYLLYGADITQAISAVLFDGEEQPDTQLQPLVDDGVLVPLPEAVGHSHLHDYRGLRFDEFASEAWAHKRFERARGDAVGLADVLKLSMLTLRLRIFGFRSVGSLAHLCPGMKSPSPGNHLDTIPPRFFRAALWCPVQIACLQMAYTLASELRSEGFDAHLVIGVRPLPFVAHAWVEVGDQVVGDQPNLRRLYGTIYSVP